MAENKDCSHEQFASTCNVFIHTESKTSDKIVRYSADLKIHCTQCGQPMEFIGVPGGYSPMQPMVSIDFTELRIPIRPSVTASLPPEQDKASNVNVN